MKLKNEKEISKIINDAINLSIISKLLNLKIIDEKQFFILKEKIKFF